MDRLETLVPNRKLYFGGAWHTPQKGESQASTDPATGAALGQIAQACAADADAAVRAAQEGYKYWRKVAPAERAKTLRAMAQVIRANADDLAWLDAIDGGSPISKMRSDVEIAASRLDYFAGLVTEMKGDTLPSRDGTATYTRREPLGVVVRIVAFNHPLMFTASRLAAPLLAGNACIVKPPEQASLSALRLAELIGPLLPQGVFGLLTGGAQTGAALARHPDVAMVGLVGSVPAGQAVYRAGSDGMKRVLLELGGKNALIAFDDADPKAVAQAMVDGMNFTWCGQSCGSTSRAFVHEAIHDEVVAEVQRCVAQIVPGLPTDPATKMGALIDHAHRDRVMAAIATAQAEGARLVCGGTPPTDAALSKGAFLSPTVFADVTHDMRIAREEIFGPVLGILKFDDTARVIEQVNDSPFGLTCSIWTNDLARAHRTADAVETGYVWVNDVSKHFVGAPFGGRKSSGIGREECLGELLFFTEEKTVHINYSGER
ncbi:aldehyde dehydrogenase family protein [Roseicitreum antarcticum]|nr:aldehyde dehydrogenase family protein [Roseicitreum antarcticum]